MNQQLGLNATEKRAAHSLAALFFLRMAGLFMLMPVLALYGQDLEGFSPFWVGMAIGAYGLTQALFQIPMGWLSDRFGRKPIIIGGLVVFAIGSAVAASSDSIFGVTLGRALQGMGAIASAVMALAADLSRETQRAKVMAFIGVSIGLSFAASLVLGPLISSWFGLSGLFWLTCGLALLGVAVVAFVVPQAEHLAPAGDVRAAPAQMKALLKHPQLLRLDWGVFTLHLLITGLFVELPLQLAGSGLAAANHWQVYLPTVLISFVLMVPLLIIAAKQDKNRGFFLFAISLLGLAFALLVSESQSLLVLAVVLVLFFTGFNYLEASLPALLSNTAPPGQKGAALGVYSTSQFLGAFVGGSGAGWLHVQFGGSGVAIAALLLIALWLVVAWNMRAPSGLKSYSLEVEVATAAPTLQTQLVALPGVVAAVVNQQDKTAYLRVSTKEFELAQALQILKPASAST